MLAGLSLMDVAVVLINWLNDIISGGSDFSCRSDNFAGANQETYNRNQQLS